MPAEPRRMGEEHDTHPTNAELAAQVRDLQNALAASRAAIPLNLIPENGAGQGDEIAPTWSQYEQEQARES